MKKISFIIVSFFAIIQLNAQESYKNGVVVTAHPEASKVGVEILKKGGNAIDASIAVQFALAVVYPNAGNIGGGGFLVYRDAKGKTDALDYREKAPLKASEDMYWDKNGNAITDLSLYGQFAAGVPGTVDGMVKAHEKYGKLNWKELVLVYLRYLFLINLVTSIVVYVLKGHNEFIFTVSFFLFSESSDSFLEDPSRSTLKSGSN